MSQPFRYLDLPAEVRCMVMDAVIADTQLCVGVWGPQNTHGPRTIRRIITDGDPADTSENSLRHPLEHVHPLITAEFRERWAREWDGSLYLGEMSSIPDGIFTNVNHLSLTMMQAVEHLQAVVPNLPSTHIDPNPPTTPLTLRDLPSLQRLDIRWTQNYSWYVVAEQQSIGVLMIRLQYFRRSFTAFVHVDVVRNNGSLIAQRTLLDGRSDWVLAPGQEALENMFRLRMCRFDWNPNNLRRGHSDQRRAVHEAHEWYDFAPLGWRYTNFATVPYRSCTATIRTTSRPYDT